MLFWAPDYRIRNILIAAVLRSLMKANKDDENSNFLKFIGEYEGPFTLDDKDTIILSSSVNGIIGNHATHFFLSSEMGAAPIPDDKNID